MISIYTIHNATPGDNMILWASAVTDSGQTLDWLKMSCCLPGWYCESFSILKNDVFGQMQIMNI